MRERLIILLVIVLVGLFHPTISFCKYEHDSQQLDSAVRVALDRRLTEYFAAIEREGAQVQKGECDFLIETCSDSLMRQHVALTVYEHYRDSKVMGSESVAIHVFDKWIGSGKVKMRDDTELLAAKIFAEFNRQSLIGNKAPELLLYDMEGNPQALFEEPSGRFTVLFFYDTSCATCKLQTILLGSLFRTEDFPIDFVAVYASDDMDSWKKYVEERLDFPSLRIRVHHLWDPEINSDFQRKYGVVQTPRMFLISPDGTIIGRSLDAQALSQMLHAIFDEVELEYGSDESMALYDGIFGDAYPSADDVIGIADYIRSSTLEKADTMMFRQMTGDLLYYLTLQRGEGFKEGLAHLVSDKILSRPDVWKSADDSLKVIGMAQMYEDLLSKSQPGKSVPDMKLPGTLLTSKKEKEGTFRLKKIGGEKNYIMFVTDGCHVCAAEKEAAHGIVSGSKAVKVLMVNVDSVLAESPELASDMFDSFDLSALPFILETDRKGKIVRRYISLQ
ncbi:MAG: redoxin domain-containing protein [Bacteroidales bacterium]|nr:redoxin domain-containing protein [Bacteroidales bacterium]